MNENINDRVIARVRQLQVERQSLAERLEELAAEMERTRHLISAYDGAIGELGLLAEQTRDGADEEAESSEEETV